MKKVIFLLNLLFIPAVIYAEELSVTLCGRVTDSFNNPVYNADIYLYSPQFDYSANTSTDTNGNYRFNKLLPGTYEAKISPSQNTNLIVEYTSLYLNLGTNTINFTLAIGGILTGRVKDELDNPIAEVELEAKHNIVNYSSSVVSTNSNGEYVITGLITGNYRLLIEPPKTLEFGEMVISGISVTQSATTTQNITLYKSGTITGKIVDHDGNPAVNIEVKATSIDSFIQKTVKTNTEGEYVLNELTPGIYNLQLKPPYQSPFVIYPPYPKIEIATITTVLPGATFTISTITTKQKMKKLDVPPKKEVEGEVIVEYPTYWYYGQPTLTQLVESITVNSRKTTYKDIVMVKWAKIKGCVKDITGNPIPAVNISAEGYKERNEPFGIDKIHYFSIATRTNSSGEYSLHWLEPISYRLIVAPPKGLNFVKKEITLKNLTAGTTTTQDFILEYGGIIIGSVKDESGNPVIDTSIEVLDYGTITDSYGNYIVMGLPSGNHLMKIRPYSTVNLTPKEIYISINELGTVTQNIILTQGGILKGKITDEAGSPISGAWIEIKDKISKSTNTDADGLYQIVGLPSGNYWLDVIPPPNRNLLRFNRCGIKVTPATTTIQNITLYHGATLSCKIKDTLDNPIINAYIRISGAYDSYYGYTNDNGEYTFTGLLGGIYEIEIDLPAKSGLPHHKTTIRVNKGTITTEEFILSTGIVISGIVTDDENQPVIGAKINLMMKYPPYTSFNATTDFHGSYTISVLGKGIYSLSIIPPKLLNLLPLNISSFEINKDTTQNITLSKGGILTGIVKDENNNPIPNVKIYLDEDTYVTTQFNGKYKFIGLSSDTYTLMIIPPEVLNLPTKYIHKIIVKEGEIITQDITLTQGGTISGRVIDILGRSVSGAKISIGSEDTLMMKSATTDAKGYFTIPNLGKGTYTLEVELSTYYSSNKETIKNIVITPGLITYKDIILTNWGMVKGIVKDEAGKPIPDIQISIKPTPIEKWEFYPIYFIPPVTTNSNGEYEIPWITGGGWYKLFIKPLEKMNLIDKEVKVYIPKGTVTTQDIILESGGIITGVVMDESQNVIKGAKIIVLEGELVAEEVKETPKEETVELQEKSKTIIPAGIEKKPIKSTKSTYTNLDGVYTILGLPSGTYTLKINPPIENKELAEKEIAQVGVIKGATTTCNIVLEQGGIITGYVLDESNQPVYPAEIRIREYSITSKTDSTGKYHLLGLPQGRYNIEVLFDARRTHLRYTIEDILVTSGTTTIRNIILDKSGIITGRVVDTSGNPIINAEISIWNEGYLAQAYTQTDFNGEYIADNLLPDENYYLEIRPPTGMNLIKQRRENIFIKSGTTTIMNIYMSSGGTIMGTVTDTNGKPIELVEVNAQGNYTYSDANGHYFITGLFAQVYKIVATPPYNNRNLAPVIIKDVKILQNSITIQNIILPIAGTLTGYIKDKANNPVDNTYIHIYTDYWGKSTKTTSDGKYTFYNLAPGIYSMTINAPQNSILVGKMIKDIEIISAKTTIQNVILDTGGVITGRVSDVNLNPIPNISIHVSGTYTSYSSQTDTNGRYIIYSLPPGRYSVSAIPPGDINLIQQSYQNIIVNVGATTTLNFVLPSGGIITGTVTDESGNPIEKTTVRIWESNISRYDMTDSKGEYTIKGLPTGVYQIEIIPEKGTPYFRKRISEIIVIVGQVTKQTFILSRGGVISGEIIDNTNDGIEKRFGVFAIPSGKKVTIHNFWDLDREAIYTDNLSIGHYSLTPIPTGNYDLYWYVMYQTGMTFFKSSPNINITQDTYITNHIITLNPITSGISGTATILENYMEREKIFLTNLKDEVVGFAEPDDSNGRYSILYLYPGTYSIWVRERWDMVKIKEDIIVEEGKVTTANITFPTPPPGTITGLVKDIHEKPISGVAVILIKYKKPIATTTTTTQGLFSFYNISSGSYRLKVLKNGYIGRIIRPFYLSANNTEIINITLQVGDGISVVVNKYEENEIFLENKIRLVLPPNSITENEETIRILKLKDNEIPPVLSLSINIKPTNIAYEFTPTNLKFTPPATITLFYPEGLNEDKLAVFYFNGTKWVYIGGKVDKGKNTISFHTNHLSLYAIMEYSSLANLNKVICYPNPFYPDKDGVCTITGIPFEADDIKVIIYNIAGELVKVFEPDEIKEGVDCKYVEWDGTNEYNYKVAYGVYIYVVKSEKGIQQGKIALIR